MGSTLTVEQTIQCFKQHKTIFIAAHIQPDGDCVGSALGLTWALRKIGKTVNVTLHDHVSKTFDFLPGYTELTPKFSTDEELIVFVDGRSPDRFGAAYNPERFGDRPVLEIDHHAKNEQFAPLNFIDVQAASCAEIIYRLVCALDVPIDQTIAQCLLTGIVTDTLGFRTTSTTTDTLRAAAELVSMGGSISTVIERVFNQEPLNSLRLRGRIYSEAQLDGEILWAQIAQKQLREFEIEKSDTGDVINQLLAVDQAKIAATFIEDEDGSVDVELRCRPGYDVAGVAARLGGGGHKQASGATIPGPLDSARGRVLGEIKANLKFQVANRE